MSDKRARLEQIIEASLEEAKKKARMKDDNDDGDEGEKDDEDETESTKEAEAVENEEEDDKPKKKKKKLKEETEAAASLHPAAKSISDPKAVGSKSGMMSGVMDHMSGMSKSDMIDFFGKVMGQYGPGKDWGVGDKSGHNQDSLDMKPSHAVSVKGPKTADGMPKLDSKGNPVESGKGLKFSVKEDVEAMFAGQELSEEFKDKATTLFEAAVNAKLVVEVAKIQEQFEQSITEEIQSFTQEVTDKLDAYLDYVVENWMTENEVAIESSLRNELMEEFISGLKGLFSEHYIDVPEQKIDVINALAEKVDSLEQMLDKTISENSEMKDIIAEVAKKEIISELASDLALTQQEKFSSLAEGIEFDGNVDAYTKKLGIIKETYFSGSSEATSTNIEEETFEGETGPSAASTNPAVNRYVQAISRTVKK